MYISLFITLEYVEGSKQDFHGRLGDTLEAGVTFHVIEGLTAACRQGVLGVPAVKISPAAKLFFFLISSYFFLFCLS